MGLTASDEMAAPLPRGTAEGGDGRAPVTAPPPEAPSPELAGVVQRNIQTLIRVRKENERARTFTERTVDGITRFSGSMPFVYLHAVLFAGWIVLNSGVVPGFTPPDPFPFVMLAMFASVEAIFLSTFVLISQNRMAALAERRAELDLQISLLSEHEITRLIAMVEAISNHLDVATVTNVEELKRDVAPEGVLREIERAERQL